MNTEDAINHGPVSVLIFEGQSGMRLFMDADLDDYTASKNQLSALSSSFAQRQASSPGDYFPEDLQFFTHEANHKLRFLGRREDFPMPYNEEVIKRSLVTNGVCFREGCSAKTTGSWTYTMVRFCSFFSPA
jgi:hypothetical protein